MLVTGVQTCALPICEEDEDEEDDDEDEDEAAYEDVVSEEGDEFEEEDAAADDGDDHIDVPAWGLEAQPPDITEEEAIAMAVANSELDQLAMWDGVAVQLRVSSLAQGRQATPPATPTRSQGPPPPTAWDP